MNQIYRLIALLSILLSTIAIASLKPIASSDLFTSPKISNLSFSPNGKVISALTREESGIFLSLIDTKTKKYTPVLEFGNGQVFSHYEWLDDTTIYLTTISGSRTNNALVSLDFSGEKPTSKYKSIRMEGYLVSILPDEPETVLFARNMFDGEPSNRLYKLSYEQLLNKQFSKKDELYQKIRNVVFFSYDDKRKELYAGKLLDDNEGVSVHRQSKGRWKKLYQINNKDTFEPVGQLNDNTLAVLTNQKSNTIGLYEFDIPTQSFTNLIYQHDKYDLTNAVIKNGQVKYVTFLQGGQQHRHYLANDKNLIFHELQNSFKDRHIAIVDSSTISNHVILFTYASDNAGQYYLYNQKNKNLSELDTYLPELEEYELTKTETFNITNSNGDEIEAFLTRPNDNNGILLVMPHGGPVGVREYNIFSREVQYFASRGYSILRLNFRGSSGYGKDFLNSGRGEFGKAIEQDITVTVDHIKSKYQYKKMCTMGSSYGGYSAVMLTIQHPDQYHCAIGTFGIYDLPLLFNANNFKSQPEFRETVAAVVGPYSADLKNYSPVYLADKISVPVLLIAGKKDNIAEVEHSERLAYALKKLNKPIETMYYDKTGHGHKNWYWDRHQASYVADYLDRTLNLVPAYHYQTDAHKLKLAEDSVIIADGFTFKNLVTIDKEKAANYYKTAAELGHIRSMFNYGLQLLDDSEDNNQSAIQWLKKASSKKYKNASFKLGEIYQEGKNAQLDHSLSLEYFTLADTQGYDAKAQLEIAKIYCLGLGVKTNVEKCTSLFNIATLKGSEDKEQKAKHTSSAVKYKKLLINDMIFNYSLSNEQLGLLQTILLEGNIQTIPVSIDENEFGKFVWKRGRRKTEDVSTSIAINEKTTFTLGFDVDWEKELLPNMSAPVFIQWQFKDSNGKLEYEYLSYLIGKTSDDWRTSYTLAKDDIKNGTLTIKIKDIFNNIIHEKSVQIVKGS